MKIGIFGYGTMGKAIHSYFLKKELNVSIYHKSDPLPETDILFICVKPGQIKEAIKLILNPAKDTIIVSILAGVPLSYLEKIFPANKVVRTMLTYPSLFGQNKANLFGMGNEEAINILSNYFNFIPITTDEDMDKITATIGCGPAFVSWLWDQYNKSMEKMLPSDKAKDWQKIMFEETLSLLEENNPNTLINKVACKDGATEAALKILKDSDLDLFLDKTFLTAFKRAENFRQNFYE